MKKNCIIQLLLLVSCSTALTAGTISGLTTLDGLPAAQFKILLIDDQGQQRIAYTDDQGKYSFPDLPEGNYLVKPDPTPGTVNSNGCEAKYVYVDDDGYSRADFFLKTTGVDVDFGTPTGHPPQIGRIFTKTGTTFQFVFKCLSLDIYEPDEIIVDGYWYIPGQGPLDTTATHGYPAGHYIGTPMLADATNYGTGEVTLVAEHQYMERNGQVAAFNFQISPLGMNQLRSSKYTMAFCAESIRLYRDGAFLAETSGEWIGKLWELRKRRHIPEDPTR